MSRLKTKADRLNYLQAEFNRLAEKGYTKEVYKDLSIFSLVGDKCLLKVFCGTSTKPLCYYSYRSQEQMGKRIQDYKNSADIRETRKTDEKGKRTISSHAAAAKAIREELKKAFTGVKFSVKSDSFSMGDSVRASWTNGPTTGEVEKITRKYQYGHFDGMTDMHESSNSRSDIPQSKYVSADRRVSEEIQKQVKDLIKSDYENLADHEYSRIYWEFISKQSIPWNATEVRVERDPEFTCGTAGEAYRFVFTLPESNESKPEGTTEIIAVGEFEIIKTKHTKRGYDLWAVKMVDRVSREKFMELLEKAKSMGGYYSSYRRDGAIPGFQFKTEQGANDFTGASGNETPSTIIPAAFNPKAQVKKPSNNDAMVSKWQKLADSYKKESDKKFLELENAQSNTPKRMREYNSKNIDANIAQEAASMAQGLADVYRDDKVPDELKVLQPVKSKGHLLHFIPGHDSTGYYDAHRSAVPRYKQHGGTMPRMDGVTSVEQADKILELLIGMDNLDAGEKEAREKQDKIKRLEDDFRFQKIPGFFPTPSELGKEMANRLRITNGQTICEPGAGLGHLAEEVRDAYPDNKLTTIEVSHSLSEILLLKGFDNMNQDFLTINEKFDRIIMNPPFEKGQDIDHVRHAYSLLNDEGRVVSIMGAGAFNNSTKKHQEFQEWVDEMGADYEQLPEGSFKNAFKSTGINTYLITIDK